MALLSATRTTLRMVVVAALLLAPGGPGATVASSAGAQDRDQPYERQETRELVNTTMSQLPPHYREALEAKYLTGRSVRDMAAVWSISEKAVESLLTRARQAFRVAFLALSRNLEVEPS